jgi:2-methylcitrate dehydratase PrpD
MGVTAALLAANGTTAPESAFEDARGFAQLFNDGVFHHSALDALGREWSLETPGIDVKRIPICLSAHAAVDNLIDILETHKLAPADIAAIACDVPTIVANNLAYRIPRQVQEAQFSLPYAIACVLVFGDIGLEHLSAQTLNDPRLAAAMSKVTMHVSDRWNSAELQQACPEGAYVTVMLRDGRKIESFTCSARGTVAKPLSDADLAKKFMSCVRPVSSDQKAVQLLSRLRAVADIENIRDLFGD